MGKEDYPAHVSDPTRRTIAERYVKHELIKLLSGLRETAAWETIQRDVTGWFSANPTLAPIRDFWNGVHAISMGFKLKLLVPWLTSFHVQWSEAEVQTEELWFTSRLEDLVKIGPEPSAKAAKKWYFADENREALEIARQAEERRSLETMPRSDFPIIAKQDGVRIFARREQLRQLALITHPSTLVGCQNP